MGGISHKGESFLMGEFLISGQTSTKESFMRGL